MKTTGVKFSIEHEVNVDGWTKTPVIAVDSEDFKSCTSKGLHDLLCAYYKLFGAPNLVPLSAVPSEKVLYMPMKMALTRGDGTFLIGIKCDEMAKWLEVCFILDDGNMTIFPVLEGVVSENGLVFKITQPRISVDFPS